MKFLADLFRGLGNLLKSLFTPRVLERIVAGCAIAIILAAFGIIKPF